MERDHPALLAVVRAVCDGARIDWHAAESELSDSVRGTLSELRALADLAGVNRSLGGETREIQNRPGLDPPSPLSSTAFARWGHLHLLEHVASGSFGDVYRAWDQAIHREVALKLLKPRHDPDERDDTI